MKEFVIYLHIEYVGVVKEIRNLLKNKNIIYRNGTSWDNVDMYSLFYRGHEIKQMQRL